MSSLIRFYYDPLVEFDSLFDDVVSACFGSCSLSAEGCQRTKHVDSYSPKLDLHESKDSNVVTATLEVPGLKSEDVTIDVHQNRLTVSGEYDASDSDEEGRYAIRERRYGKFSRALRLPFGTKPEDVKAKLENGILTVTFPKANSEQQPQRIAIQ